MAPVSPAAAPAPNVPRRLRGLLTRAFSLFAPHPAEDTPPVAPPPNPPAAQKPVVDAFFRYSARQAIAWAVEMIEAVELREREVLPAAGDLPLTQAGLEALLPAGFTLVCAAAAARPKPTCKTVFLMLTDKGAYEEFLFARKVFVRLPPQRDAAGNEVLKAEPGELLRGYTEHRDRWTLGLDRLDAALWYFRHCFWALPNETLRNLQMTLGLALASYADLPLEYVAGDFSLKILRQEVAASIRQAGSASGNPYFQFQARLNIIMGARLLEAVEERAREITPHAPSRPYGCADLRAMLMNKDFYEELLMDRRVFTTKKIKKDAAGDEVPRIVPGDLLKGMNDDPKTWSPAMATLDATLRHFKGNYWALPKETLGGIQMTAGMAVGAYRNEPLSRLHADFDLETLQEEVAASVRGYP